MNEPEILKFWEENDIFQKTLEKNSPKGEFIFYDGPPFATGSPHYGHLLAGTMKDVIPRFKTMQGYHVPRRWGWDTHGLPIENLVEKELGLKSKKDIEELGVEKFNEAAQAMVLRYEHVWKNIVPRTGRFVDMDNPYLTLEPEYSESIWWSFKTLYDKNLIYNGFKVLYYCPHDETTLSNFEVSQGYKDITDLSVYVKFELQDEPGTFVVAWTTTPWTLPGNVALAVHPDIEYVEIKMGKEKYILAKERLSVFRDKEYTIEKEFKGSKLVGKKYKPVFPYYENAELKNKENIWKIVGASFVTTTDGTGVVHIAPAFGEDDYTLSLEENLPFIQHVDTSGKFKKEVTDFIGISVKPKSDTEKERMSADIAILKYLQDHDSFFAKEKITHSYPHCWRCDTPLLNYATSSWFVKVTDIKDTLVNENSSVNWIPPEIGTGRFGKWLENARDWAISRSRYWGAPLPVWICEECEQTKIIGSVEDVRAETKHNTYFVVRHGEADHNVQNILSSDPKNPHHLTDLGREEVALSAQALKDKKIDLIIASPFIRTRETVDVLVEQLGYHGQIVFDERLGEFDFGDYNLKNFELYHQYFDSVKERLTKPLPHGECINDVRKRIGDFLYEIDAKYKDKTIVLVTHDGPATVLFAVAEGADDKKVIDLWGLDQDFLSPGQEMTLDFAPIPHNHMYELDLHRPYIDDITFECSCRGTMRRVPEVFDTWYESGSMPYASLHYPFDNKDVFDEGKRFPADFIAEGQDQTRGWFYSLLVLNVGLFNRAPYKNVIVNGTILAEDGQKMSKRLNNYPEVTDILEKYGADSMRYYLMASPAVHAEDLAFSEKGVDDVYKKIIMRLHNVYTFYATYASEEKVFDPSSIKNILDRWILARLGELSRTMTESLERYELDRGAKPIMSFIDDLSTWYLRRSRDRFKGEDVDDKQSALHTTHFVLFELSKLMAPYMPFMAEDMYQKVKPQNGLLSVHLESWPEFKPQGDEQKNIETMATTRKIVEEALALRNASKIRVRQPLAKLSINPKHFSVPQDYFDLIKDELNVKEIIFDETIDSAQAMKLDTTLTPELVAEGQAREFIRAVQDIRKKMKLNPSDIVSLKIETTKSGEGLIKKFEKEISKTAQLKDITFANTHGEKIEIEDTSFTVSIHS
jgi:isoleucyl-tRNA synthetase